MWRLIDESTSEMKKLLVANGVGKFPSGMRFLDNRADWEKSNGYAGRKTLDAIHQQIEDAGWTGVIVRLGYRQMARLQEMETSTPLLMAGLWQACIPTMVAPPATTASQSRSS